MQDGFGGETISTSSFDFQGADAAISEVVTTWNYWSYKGAYDLDDISFKVTNNGDLAVYIKNGSLTIGNKHADFYFTESCVLPHENRTFWQIGSLYDFTPGQKTLTLELRDASDRLVCSYSSTIIPSK